MNSSAAGEKLDRLILVQASERQASIQKDLQTLWNTCEEGIEFELGNPRGWDSSDPDGFTDMKVIIERIAKLITGIEKLEYTGSRLKYFVAEESDPDVEPQEFYEATDSSGMPDGAKSSHVLNQCSYKGYQYHWQSPTIPGGICGWYRGDKVNP